MVWVGCTLLTLAEWVFRQLPLPPLAGWVSRTLPLLFLGMCVSKSLMGLVDALTLYRAHVILISSPATTVGDVPPWLPFKCTLPLQP